MDEKDILNNPSPTNDLTAAPVAIHESPMSWVGHLSDYKEKALDFFKDLRPVKAVDMLDEVVHDAIPKDPQPNTAHAIIEAARKAALQAAKDSLTTKQSFAIGSPQDPNRISMSTNKPVENTFADKDPQTYQQMLPTAKISPQIAQKGQSMPTAMGKLANVDPYTGLPDDSFSPREALLAAGGAGVGAGLVQHRLSRSRANRELSQVAGEYLHMAETGGFNRNKLRLLNQELAERGLSNRLVEAGSKGIAKARMDKVIGELGNNMLHSKLRAAAPFALLGASVPYLHEKMEDFL